MPVKCEDLEGTFLPLDNVVEVRLLTAQRAQPSTPGGPCGHIASLRLITHGPCATSPRAGQWRAPGPHRVREARRPRQQQACRLICPATPRGARPPACPSAALLSFRWPHAPSRRLSAPPELPSPGIPHGRLSILRRNWRKSIFVLEGGRTSCQIGAWLHTHFPERAPSRAPLQAAPSAKAAAAIAAEGAAAAEAGSPAAVGTAAVGAAGAGAAAAGAGAPLAKMKAPKPRQPQRPQPQRPQPPAVPPPPVPPPPAALSEVSRVTVSCGALRGCYVVEQSTVELPGGEARTMALLLAARSCLQACPGERSQTLMLLSGAGAAYIWRGTSCEKGTAGRKQK